MHMYHSGNPHGTATATPTVHDCGFILFQDRIPLQILPEHGHLEEPLGGGLLLVTVDAADVVGAKLCRMTEFPMCPSTLTSCSRLMSDWPGTKKT